MERRHILIFILSFIVLATAGIIVYLFIPKGATAPAVSVPNPPFVVPQPPPTPVIPTPTAQIPKDNVLSVPKDWKTYTNTKYHYSFRYPKEYKVWQFVGVGSFAPITSDADAVLVSKNKEKEAIFEVVGTNFKSLDIDAIKRQFIGTTKPEDIQFLKFNIQGQISYNLKFRQKQGWVNSDFYFVENFNNQILQIIADSEKTESNQVFSSVHFTN